MSGSLLLAIESSCDDTSVALMSGLRDVCSWKISSQVALHSQFGGVVPEYAGRLHLNAVLPLLDQLFHDAGVSCPQDQIGAVAVTSGPGLIGSLLVGVMTAKALAQSWSVPLIGVNHLEGHLFAPLIEHKSLDFPYLGVIVSGGHSEIILAQRPGSYQRLAKTRDDAAGEAFDKVAKILGMGYPGGPYVEKCAANGNPKAYDFPRPSFEQSLDMSFSGLKTAVLNAVNKAKMKDQPLNPADLCASFQTAVADCLFDRVSRAVQQTGITQVALSGGVAANSFLRRRLGESDRWTLLAPSKAFCTDNAVMIGAAGWVAWSAGVFDDLTLTPNPNRELRHL